MAQEIDLSEREMAAGLQVLLDDLHDLPEIVVDWDSLPQSEQIFHESEWGPNISSTWAGIVRMHQLPGFPLGLERSYRKVEEGLRDALPLFSRLGWVEFRANAERLLDTEPVQA